MRCPPTSRTPSSPTRAGASSRAGRHDQATPTGTVQAPCPSRTRSVEAVRRTGTALQQAPAWAGVARPVQQQQQYQQGMARLVMRWLAWPATTAGRSPLQLPLLQTPPMQGMRMRRCPGQSRPPMRHGRRSLLQPLPPRRPLLLLLYTALPQIRPRLPALLLLAAVQKPPLLQALQRQTGCRLNQQPLQPLQPRQRRRLRLLP